MNSVLLRLSLVALIGAIVCVASAATRLLRALRELPKPGSLATHVLAFLVFLFEESVTDAGKTHGTRLPMGRAMGMALLLSACGFKSTARI